MKIVIPGGSGQVGTLLARHFHGEKHEVVVLGRKPRSLPWSFARWDGENAGDWWEQIDGADVVINLAGRSVNCRYNTKNRREILHSRVTSTRAVGEAIAAARNPPRVWLQAGTATIYPHRFDAANDEFTGIAGGRENAGDDSWRFSVEVAESWERAAREARTPRTRKVILRSAMTMSPDAGGVFDMLLRLVRSGLGGRAGDGRQYVSWIHEVDFIRAVRWIIGHEDMDGAVNLSAPGPLPNSAFMRILRGAWGIRFGMPASKWMLEIGARILNTETELVLKSRRVVPRRLLESGFGFSFPEWQEAAADLCRRWRLRNGAVNHSGRQPGV